jgi:hypothetical protein
LRTLAAMSDDDDTPGGAEGAVPEAGRGWSEQDRRTLIITVAGGLAANVGTVILVGGAIAFVHLRRHSSVWWQLATALEVIVLGLIFVAVGIAARRGRRFGPVPAWSVERRVLGVPRSWFGWYLVAMGWLLVLEAALIVVGLAAGVK